MQGAGSRRDLEVVALVSRDRLNGYAVHGGPNTDRDLLGRYLYNVAISQALYPFLHTLEVVLRNRIFATVDAAAPIDRDRPDLYDRFPCWLDATHALLTLDHRAVIAEAKRGVASDLKRRHGGRAAEDRRFLTPGRLVAKMSFAFWVYLFDREYVSTRPGDLGILWPRYFAQVFPARHGRVTVGGVGRALRRLLVVRNRTMHYERITPWSDGADALDPRHVRRDVLDLVRWMSPRAAAALEQYGEWPPVFSDGYARYLRRNAGAL